MEKISHNPKVMMTNKLIKTLIRRFCHITWNPMSDLSNANYHGNFRKFTDMFERKRYWL